MAWRLKWPPWRSERVEADRRRAFQELERATIDLAETRQKVQRTARVTANLQHVRGRNHFSESMEALFASAGKGHHGTAQRGG